MRIVDIIVHKIACMYIYCLICIMMYHIIINEIFLITYCRTLCRDYDERAVRLPSTTGVGIGI